MTTKIETAVVLAAGAGIRIREFFDVPKGFIKINDRPIIEISVEKLIAVGINRIVIVTGYNHNFYETLAIKYPLIELIFNEKYASCNHLYSLCCIKGIVNESFLLLESDIVYEQRALEKILDIDESNAIIVSAVSGSGDEVFVESRNENLVNMSKDSKSINQITGEFIGISLFSMPFFNKIFELAEKDITNLSTGSYDTNGITSAAQYFPVYCLLIQDLIWVEIDTYEMYVDAIKIF
ncbi:Nucleotidyl transferase [Pedobacter cryoconitis]|uniref:Nucleotidyl transferase n=1 Tax=Pedobacter cryoconitis TaxID=188932 RepID=A0A127V818_9SPHI|nr:phosphocholine cytidylyltransferase family protein [Pedobacter cryoconitis]AMP97400.1 Nucleotidyl transferase [Pedobacter cryoconitis]